MLELLYSFFTGYDAHAILAIAPIVVAGLISAAGSIIGQVAKGGGGDDRRSEALQQFMDLNIPSIEDQQIFLQQLKQQGVLTPQMEQYMSAGESAYDKISLDPSTRAAQMKALGEFGNIAAGGIDLKGQADIDNVLRQINTDEQGKRQAIMQGAARRGMGGSGMELGAQLMNQQQAANQAGTQGLNIAAMGQQNRLAALNNLASLGGSIGAQDWQQAAQKASASDVMNQFNTGLASGVQQRNIAGQNYAAEKNLGTTQDIANQNVGLSNYQQQYNKALIPAQYGQQLDLAKAKANALTGQAQAEDASSAATQKAWTEAGLGAGKIAYEALKPEKKKSIWEA